jgi:hypothetical protein
MTLLDKFSTLMIATYISAGAFSFLSIPVLAQQVTYKCKVINDVPTTVFNYNGKERQMISWVRSFANGYTPERRCEEVTGRLNKYASSSGQFITHGIINQLPVICFTDKKGAGCNNLLITLKRGDDAKEKLASWYALKNNDYSSDSPMREGSCSLYININAVINEEKAKADVVCFQNE